ncbi:MAG: hypothetical protein ABEH59_06495 [Halobacteriales archaeon]
MQPATSEYKTVDEAALLLGLAFVLLGAAVMGVFETLLGSVHVTQRVSGVGVLVLHTSFNPHLRAYIIAIGLLILLGWGLSRVSRAIRV